MDITKALATLKAWKLRKDAKGCGCKSEDTIICYQWVHDTDKDDKECHCPCHKV